MPKSAFTAKTKATILNEAERGASLSMCARAAGISRVTLTNWLREGKEPESVYHEFAVQYHRATANYESRLLADINEGASAKTKLDLLSRKNPEDWAMTKKIEITVMKEQEKLLDYLATVLDADVYEAVLVALTAYTPETDLA